MKKIKGIIFIIFYFVILIILSLVFIWAGPLNPPENFWADFGLFATGILIVLSLPWFLVRSNSKITVFDYLKVVTVLVIGPAILFLTFYIFGGVNIFEYLPTWRGY